MFEKNWKNVEFVLKTCIFLKIFLIFFWKNRPKSGISTI